MKLVRYYSGDDCTLGVLSDGKGFYLYTLENPWLDNAPNISCIPCGTYNVISHTGTKYKDVWRLEGVDGRYTILIHWGNTAKNTEGCILVGTSVGELSGRRAVLSSRKAVDLLRDYGGLETITIEDM